MPIELDARMGKRASLLSQRHADGDDVAPSQVPVRRERLSALLDGERPGSATSSREPISDDCQVSWRGYCITRSVLRGEFNSAGMPLCGAAPDELTRRIRRVLDAESGTEPAVHALAGRGRRWPLVDALRPRANAWRSTLRGRRQRVRTGALIAGTAMVCSVAIGVGIARFERPTSGSVVANGPAAGLTAAAQPAAASEPDVQSPFGITVLSDSPVLTVGAMGDTGLPPGHAPPRVQRVVESSDGRHGQLPYFFRHANAHHGSMRPSAVMLIPIAGTDTSASLLHSNLVATSQSQ